MPVSALFWIVPARDRNTWWGLAQWHSGTVAHASLHLLLAHTSSASQNFQQRNQPVVQSTVHSVPEIYQRSLCFSQDGSIRTLSWHSHFRKLFIIYYIFWTPRRSLQRTCAMSANIHCYQDIQQMLYLRRAITILQYVKYLENLL